MHERIVRDEAREKRIDNEALVDTYGPEEQAMGWYCYLEDRLAFPFLARCIEKRRISPLEIGEVIEVTGMAPQEDCMSDMIVIVAWQNRELGVPLAQLEPVNVDADTAEAVGDWHYWLARDNELG